MTPQWKPLADLLSEATRRLLGADLVAVWLHGSAALGGWVEGRSDLDALVVVTDTCERDWRALGEALAQALVPAPLDLRVPVELSVIRQSLAQRPVAPWPFLVHVTTGPERVRVEVDRGDGDPDLLLHLAVAQAAGVALDGPSPADVAVPPDRDAVVAQLADELAWGVDNADEAYAVLNACRALRYAETGDLVSKVVGGEWLLHRRPEHRVVVERALDAQRRGIRLEGATMAGRALVQDVLDDLLWA